MRRDPGRPVDPAKDRAILRAARDLLFGLGPQALTMEAVAERAGVSKVTVYARYANRQRLLQAVVESEAFVIMQPIVEVPDTRDELARGLRTFAETVSAFLNGRRHQRLMQVLGAVPQKGADLAHLYRNGPEIAHNSLARYLQEAGARGIVQCPEPRASAELFFGMAVGLDLLRMPFRLPSERRTREARARHAQRVVDAFLAIHAPRSGR